MALLSLSLVVLAATYLVWGRGRFGASVDSSSKAGRDIIASPGPQALSPIRKSATKAEPLPEVAGWLIDSAGLPIAGVAVHKMSAKREPTEVLAITEADGAYRFSSAPRDGEELMLIGDSIFASTFRQGAQDKGVRIMGTRRMALTAHVVLNGKAAVGAEVELLDGSGPTGQILRTDNEGMAVFEGLVPGAYEVWAHQSGLASLVAQEPRLTQSSPPVELALQKAVGGKGRIVDAQGQGIEAALRLLPKNAGYAARELASGPDGSFSLDSLLPGRWQLEARASGFVSQLPYVLEVGADVLDIRLKMQRGATLLGRVLDDRGLPVANAKIVVQSQRKVTRAEAPRARLGGNTMRWVHPLASRRAMPGHHSRRFGAGRDGVRPSECGRGHCGVDLGSERGRVVHAAADAKVLRVARESKGKAGRYLVLGHRGGLKSFYMHLDEIDPELDVGAQVSAGAAIATIGRTGVIRSGPHLHFSISQEQGGRTWYIDPEPILQHAVVLPRPRTLGGSRHHLDATLALLVDDEHKGAARAANTQGISSILHTDDEGRFHKAGLEAGSYRYLAYHDEMAPSSSARFSLRLGRESDEVIVQLAPGVEIVGQVLGPEGPVRDALIVAEEGSALLSRVVAKTHSDAEGRYRLRPLSGSLSLRVSAPGYGDAQRSVRLAHAKESGRDHAETFSLSLQNRQLEGLVRDLAGFPVRAAQIRIVSGPSGRGRRVTSDEYGRFEIPELSKGRYQLAVVSAEFPTAKASMDTEGTHEIRLEAGAEIHLRLLDAHNREALVGVRVKAVGPKDEHTTVVSNQEGLARFPKMRAGTWKMAVKHDGYVRREDRIKVTLGSDDRASRVERSVALTRGAALAGILRDQNGDRVAGGRVWVGKSTAITDQEGRFRLRDVATGAVEVRAEYQKEEGALSLELGAGDEIVTLDLRLQ